MTTYESTHRTRRQIPWGAVRAAVERRALAVAGASGLVAGAWVGLGTALGLTAAGLAAFLLEWRFQKR